MRGNLVESLRLVWRRGSDEQPDFLFLLDLKQLAVSRQKLRGR